ncbi:MAG TPA: hypothetical protein VJ819_14810 [Nocardioidaceae bacterium]|nr:hypothetical protein [Nocardioidaceae bacterium]
MANDQDERVQQLKSEVDDLEAQLERYRRASEDLMQQVDWCIGYFHGCGKKSIAKSLSNNRSYIRKHLLRRSEQADPSSAVDTNS